MGPPLEPVSAMVPPDHRAQIKRIGGKQGVSAGLRIVICAGLAALRGQTPRLLAAIDELQELADGMAATAGRRTPSGGWWAPTPEALPPADQLTTGDVVVTPIGLTVVGLQGTLTLDSETSVTTLVDEGGEVAAELPLEALLELSALLQPALLGLARGGPDARALGASGLHVERRADGLVRLSLAGHGLVMPVCGAWLLAAELAGLAARALDASATMRAALNRKLQEVG